MDLTTTLYGNMLLTVITWFHKQWLLQGMFSAGNDTNSHNAGDCFVTVSNNHMVMTQSNMLGWFMFKQEHLLTSSVLHKCCLCFEVDACSCTGCIEYHFTTSESWPSVLLLLRKRVLSLPSCFDSEIDGSFIVSTCQQTRHQRCSTTRRNCQGNCICDLRDAIKCYQMIF